MASGSESGAATGRVFGPRGTKILLPVCCAAIAVLAVAVGVLAARPGGSPGARGAGTPAVTASPTPTGPPSVTDIYQRVGPSVVVVRTGGGSLGSGVVAANDGTVLTANHVIADGGPISLTFSDGTTSTATVASADPGTDIATLTPATLPQPVVPATLGGRVEVGGEVVAVGNPLGLTYSVSSGVISGVGRTATTDTGRLSNLIQFDASVNAGSSGGPLLDADGLVVGIVVSIADPGSDDAFAGIGFAVPIGSALGGGGDGTGGGRGPQI
ncbi:S1C family serine protease [Parafrankia discariae]|uniref:S1C family serine protease n=1 Tax=Parafrankia discariae TaxID=365528 RepID=UPI00035E15C8|nr:trypsin-like peptidase domain-containing protein [Parafrankia discariae]